MTKTHAKSTAALLFIALAAATGVRAQDYPAKPIALIMPFAAGGPGDTMARHLGTAMSAALKQQIVVENPSGAGGTIGINKVARSRPDGYTLLIMNIGMSTAPTLYRNLPYNVIDDFDHIGRVADVPMVIVGKKGLAPGNFKELLAHIRAEKQKVTLGPCRPRIGLTSVRTAFHERHPTGTDAGGVQGHGAGVEGCGWRAYRPPVRSDDGYHARRSRAARSRSTASLQGSECPCYLTFRHSTSRG